MTGYFVAVNGSDSNPGTLAAPFRTIQKAVNVLKPGDTLYVRGGVYYETVTVSNSGTATAPIRIRAYAGENPIVDGNNYTLPTNTWGTLFLLTGSYVEADGLEVRYSNWMGVQLRGQHDTVSHFNVHHAREQGIIATGDYGVVEYNSVSQCANRNDPSQAGYVPGYAWAGALSAARDQVDGITDSVVLRGNTSYNNWGEGLSTFEANGTLIEDNVVYNNFTNIYVSDSKNVVVQRNLVYKTPNNLMDQAGVGSQVGIMLGDEVYPFTGSVNSGGSANITIVNNVVLGTNRGFYWWQGTKGGGMYSVLVAYNTFVNSINSSGGNFRIDSGPHYDTRIVDNIVEQDDALPIGSIGTATQLTFARNLWSKAPSSSIPSASDMIGNPQLKKSGWDGRAGTLTGDWFGVSAGSSPAVDAAQKLAEVTDDYFKRLRGSAPTVGGAEYGSVP